MPLYTRSHSFSTQFWIYLLLTRIHSSIYFEWLMNEWINECLVTPQHTTNIAKWAANKRYIPLHINKYNQINLMSSFTTFTNLNLVCFCVVVFCGFFVLLLLVYCGFFVGFLGFLYYFFQFILSAWNLFLLLFSNCFYPLWNLNTSTELLKHVLGGSWYWNVVQPLDHYIWYPTRLVYLFIYFLYIFFF